MSEYTKEDEIALRRVAGRWKESHDSVKQARGYQLTRALDALSQSPALQEERGAASEIIRSALAGQMPQLSSGDGRALQEEVEGLRERIEEQFLKLTEASYQAANHEVRALKAEAQRDEAVKRHANSAMAAKKAMEAAKRVCAPEPVVLDGKDICPVPVADIVDLHDALQSTGDVK